MFTSRRNFLAVLAGTSVSSPSVARTHQARVTQRELDGSIEQHAIWLQDRRRGRRAAFADRDLSGLDFHIDCKELVDLRGADFTSADLSGVTGNLVSFGRASLHYARLSQSRLIEPGFINASLRGAICENIAWGLSAQPSAGLQNSGAVMFNCDAGYGDFRHARIRGHFLETNFIAASLVDADFSYSTFSGSHLQQTCFFRADLTRARFDHADLAYARFSQATLAGTDFSRARIDPCVKLPTTDAN